MPLNAYYKGHGEDVMNSMVDRYGQKKGKSVFYATAEKRGLKPMADGGMVGWGESANEGEPDPEELQRIEQLRNQLVARESTPEPPPTPEVIPPRTITGGPAAGSTVLNTVPPRALPAQDQESSGSDTETAPAPTPPIAPRIPPPTTTPVDMTALEKAEQGPAGGSIQGRAGAVPAGPIQPAPTAKQQAADRAREAYSVEGNKKIPGWKQALGGVLMATGWGGAAGANLSGISGRRRAERELGLREEAVKQELAIQKEADDARVKEEQVAGAREGRAAAATQRLLSLKPKETAAERLQQLDALPPNETARLDPTLRLEFILTGKLTPSTVTSSERPVEGPGGVITAQPFNTIKNRSVLAPGSQPAPAATPATTTQPTTGDTGIQIPTRVPSQPNKDQLASLNNNPGNLEFRNQPGAVLGDDGRFAKFETPQAGYDALVAQIKLDAGRGLTVGGYIAKFAPPGGKDGNDTAAYTQNAVKALGVSPTTPLAQVDPAKMAQFQVKQESGSTMGAPATPVAPTAPAHPQIPGRVVGQKNPSGTLVSIPGLAPGDPSQTGEGAKATGEAFLRMLPPGTQSQINAILSGAAVLPPINNRGVAVPLRDAVFRADPEFNEQRAQIRKAFTSGPDGRNIGALNTAPVHLDQLYEAAMAMNNGTFRPGNKLYNWVAEQFGQDKVTDYNFVMNALAGETASALKGNATDPEIAHVLGTLARDMSPKQAMGVAKEGLKVFGAKLNTYDERYHRENPKDKWSAILPSARDVFIKHGVGLPSGAQSTPQEGSKGQGGGYKYTAGGGRAGSNDGKTWFDVKTGQPWK